MPSDRRMSSSGSSSSDKVSSGPLRSRIANEILAQHAHDQINAAVAAERAQSEELERQKQEAKERTQEKRARRRQGETRGRLAAELPSKDLLAKAKAKKAATELTSAELETQLKVKEEFTLGVLQENTAQKEHGIAALHTAIAAKKIKGRIEHLLENYRRHNSVLLLFLVYYM